MKKRVYIAIPYTGNEEISHRIANRVTAWIVQNTDYVPISPISMFHKLANTHNLDTNFDRWQSINFGLIDACDKMLVVHNNKLNKEKSKGVQAEISYAQSRLIEIMSIPVQPKGDISDICFTKESRYTEKNKELCKFFEIQ